MLGSGYTSIGTQDLKVNIKILITLDVGAPCDDCGSSSRLARVLM